MMLKPGYGGVNAFAEKPKLPENFEDVTWETLKMAIRAVHAKQPVAMSFEDLYRVS